MLFLEIKGTMARIPRKRTHKTESQYEPKIHTKTKGGHGFGMKKGIKSTDWENCGGQLAEVFGWELPPHLQKLKDEYEKEQKKNA